VSETLDTGLLTEAPRRPRGRPRKSPDDRDEGNRRQLLIHAAAALFRNKGFAATSTRDIAAAVGMQSGSPFYHFKSKGALLHEVMAQGMRSALRQQALALQALRQSHDAAQAVGDEYSGGAAPSPAEALRALIRAHFDILLCPGSDFVPVMLYEWRSLTPRQRETVVALQREYEAPWLPVLQDLHRQGRLHANVHLARLLILGALNWSVQWFNAEQGGSLDELSDVALRLFIHPEAA